MNGQRHVLQRIDRLGATIRFTSLLDRGQQQANQNGNDRDDDEQLDQREAALSRQTRR